MKNLMDWFKKLVRKPLFLPLFSVFLVLIINVVYDAVQGNNALEFFKLELKEGALYGRIIDILNRGSEAAILAIGMTLVVSSSAGTDISVGSVMSLAGSLCCMLLAGFGVTHVREIGDLQMPIFIGVIAGIAIAGLCGLFNGFLVAKMKIQPMVATLIFFTAGRAIGLLLTNNKMVYIHLDEFKVFGGKLWIFPTPTVIAVICIAIMVLILKTTSFGMYVQSVGINPKASRIAGINSVAIILLCYVICGLFSGVAGIVATSRIYSADSNNIGLNLELDAILAVALGGNSLGGGRFNLAGSIIGAYTIQAITTTMYALGVAKAQAPVYKAIIVILIVVVQSPVVKAYFAHRRAQKDSRLALAGRG